jgi:hypothetical protein
MLGRNGDGHGLREDETVRRFQSQWPFMFRGQLPASLYAEAGLVPQSEAYIQESTRQQTVPTGGLMEVFVRICQRWRLSDEQQMILLGYPDAPIFYDQLKLGRAPLLSQDAKDRVGYVLHISIGLGALYDDDEEAELAWLRRPRDELDKKSALEFMLHGKMTHLFAVSEVVLAARSP